MPRHHIVKCTNCKSDDVDRFEHGTWLLPDAPLPHYCCRNCRTVFSLGDEGEKMVTKKELRAEAKKTQEILRRMEKDPASIERGEELHRRVSTLRSEDVLENLGCVC